MTTILRLPEHEAVETALRALGEALEALEPAQAVRGADGALRILDEGIQRFAALKRTNIRTMYDEFGYSVRELAGEFDLSPARIHQIINA